MKTLIIYQSIHHGNTEKVARKIAEVLGADLKKPNEVKPEDLANYDLIGFGSGIYFTKFHVSILNFINALPDMAGKKVFTFCTHGSSIYPPGGWNKKIQAILKQKGFEAVGSFQCQGFDTFGPFKWIGGLCKGRPNENDLSAAAQFAEGLK
jgi:flavodoxin